MNGPMSGPAEEPLNVLVVFGSVRRDRKGLRVAHALMEELARRGHAPELADPAEIVLPLLDRMYKEYPEGEAPEPMERLAGMIRRADAVIVVSAEYNHAPPAALKNMLDHFLEEWNGKPCGICTYSAGPFGGVRAAMGLRMILAELGMPTMPTLLPVPRVGAGDALGERFEQGMERFLDELTWWAGAARMRRAADGQD